MSSYHYRGHLPFLEAAARELALSAVAGLARKSPALTALSHLCAQAAHAGDEHRGPILTEAERLRDQLLVSYKAAELILADVRAGLGLSSAGVCEIDVKTEVEAKGPARGRGRSSKKA